MVNFLCALRALTSGYDHIVLNTILREKMVHFILLIYYFAAIKYVILFVIPNSSFNSMFKPKFQQRIRSRRPTKNAIEPMHVRKLILMKIVNR